MAKQICSKCGYEGKGKPLGERKGGGIARLLGILTMLPFHTLWKMGSNRGGELCPFCGLPAMVKKNSNAGRLSAHMMDVQLGIIKPKLDAKKPVEAFGNERSAEKMETKKPVNPEEW